MGIIYNLETDEEQLPPNVMLANDYYYCEYDGTISRSRILQLAKKEMERLEFEDIEMQAIAEMRVGI